MGGVSGGGCEDWGGSVVATAPSADVIRGIGFSSEGSESVCMVLVCCLEAGDWEIGRVNTISSSSFCAALASASRIGSLSFSLFLPVKGFFVSSSAAAIAPVLLRTAFASFLVYSSVFIGVDVGKGVFAVQRGR